MTKNKRKKQIKPVYDAVTLKHIGKLSKHIHYMIETNKIHYATDINANCKEFLIGVCSMLMEGHPYFKDNKTIAKKLHTTPRTIRNIINKLEGQKYLRFKYNRQCNYRYLSYINIKKTGLQGSYKAVKTTINPYRSRNKHHKIIRTTIPASHPIHKSNKVSKHITAIHKPSTHKVTIPSFSKYLIKQTAKDMSKVFTKYSSHVISNVLNKAYRKNANTSHPLKTANLFLALKIITYRKQQKSLIKHPIGLLCDISSDNHDSLLKRYINVKSSIENTKNINKNKEKITKLNKAYKINGVCYLRVESNVFYPDVKHKLETNQINKHQYTFYRNYYDKHGNKYGDAF